MPFTPDTVGAEDTIAKDERGDKYQYVRNLAKD